MKLSQKAFETYVTKHDIKQIIEDQRSGKINIYAMGFSDVKDFLFAVMDVKIPSAPRQRKDLDTEEDIDRFVNNFIAGKKEKLFLLDYFRADSHLITLYNEETHNELDRRAGQRNKLRFHLEMLIIETYAPIKTPGRGTYVYVAVIRDFEKREIAQSINIEMAQFFFTEDDARFWVRESLKQVLFKTYEKEHLITIDEHDVHSTQVFAQLRFKTKDVPLIVSETLVEVGKTHTYSFDDPHTRVDALELFIFIKEVAYFQHAEEDSSE
jgi:hypothetical protein